MKVAEGTVEKNICSKRRVKSNLPVHEATAGPKTLSAENPHASISLFIAASRLEEVRDEMFSDISNMSHMSNLLCNGS